MSNLFYAAFAGVCVGAYCLLLGFVVGSLIVAIDEWGS